MTNTSTMSLRQEHRQRTWDELRTVARPDSRFAWDFGEFIPDYEGSERGADRLRSLGDELGLESWLITPDNNLDRLRESLLADGIPFIMPSYGIRRGFLQLTRDDVPDGQEAFAGALDGVTRYGRTIPIEQLSDAYEKLDILVTGASFVTADGLRMGKGHGYFDLEWAMLRHVGLVDESTTVVAAAHDVQLVEKGVIDREAVRSDHDTIVDYVVTPNETRKVEDPPAKPNGIMWELLDETDIDAIPPLKQLWKGRE